MKFRKYDPVKDKKDAFRIWLECGWVEDEDNDKKAFDVYCTNSNCQVVEVNGSAECLILVTPGQMRYLHTDLKLSAVTGVTVSRILRKQGATAVLLADMLKNEIKNGSAVIGLGMFEQGFYNRFGFATMGYEHWVSFDPSKLSVYKKGGIPLRLTTENWREMTECYSKRQKAHGFVSLDLPEIMRGDFMSVPNGFGLGFETEGKLSHFIWGYSKDPEQGPYTIILTVFQNWNQFLELMGLIKSLEDQVRTVKMKEPAFIQIQDFINRPFQLQKITEKSQFESRINAKAYQQLRIANLEPCIEAVHYDGKPFSFNLTLSDPILNFIKDDPDFKGCSGDYTVSIGEESFVKKGHSPGLPNITGSVNGFTRLWIGVLPASTLGLVEDISIDESLIPDLIKAFYNPDVRCDMDY